MVTSAPSTEPGAVWRYAGEALAYAWTEGRIMVTIASPRPIAARDN
jgi:hypothetical protein